MKSKRTSLSVVLQYINEYKLIDGFMCMLISIKEGKFSFSTAAENSLSKKHSVTVV